jgi:hypothetical protein
MANFAENDFLRVHQIEIKDIAGKGHATDGNEVGIR